MARANVLPLSSGPGSAAIVLAAIVTLLAIPTLAPRACAAQGDPREPPPRQPALEGKPVFEAKGCVRCHSVWGSKDKPMLGPDLGRDGSWSDMTQFAGGLWNHAPAMSDKLRGQTFEPPPVSQDEMGKLAAYLFYVRFLGEPGDVQRGRELFEQRQCVQCHQLGGHGGRVGPRLDELGAYASSFFMAQALWNHGPEMAAKMAELHVGHPRLEGSDVADIVALIRNGAQTAESLDRAYGYAGSPREGQAVFQDKGCVKCHAIAGTGGTVGPDLGKQRLARHVSDMAGALWNHGPPMWAKMKELGVRFPRLTDREMMDLLAYLDFVQYMHEGGDAARGREIFRQKSCAECHATGKTETAAGPDLGASSTLHSPVRWATAMWNHGLAVRKKVPETQLAWPRFEDDEMRDLVEFLASHGGSK